MAAFIPPTPVTGVVGRAPSAAVSAWRPRQLRAPRRSPPPAPRQWRAAAGASTPAAAAPTADARPLSPGDTIAVVGATGGVGLLTLRRLAALPGAPYALRAVSRSTPADGLLPRGVTAVRGDVRRPAGSSSSSGSGGSGSGGNVDSLAACLADAAVVIISVGTTAFPTLAWRGGNTPRAVDEQGVAAVVAALGPTTTRVVFVSSIGVERRGQFPFCVLNAFGVLDAKAAGEALVAAWVAASPAARSAVVVRPGRLTGAPQTNVGTTWVGGCPAEEEAGVVARDDTLLGDVSRSVTADAVAWAVTAGGGGVMDFSVVGRRVEKGRGGDWTADLDGLLVE